MFKFLKNLSTRKKPKKHLEYVEEGAIIEVNRIIATGGRCMALGIDAKLKPSGICTNSDIIPEDMKKEDPFNPIDRCIFCRDGINCYFAGECGNRKSLEE